MTASNAEKILGYLRDQGKPVYRTDLMITCFHRHISAAELNLALEHLQLQTPPRITVSEAPKRGNPKQMAQKIAILPETHREPGEPGEPATVVRPEQVRSECEPGEPGPGNSDPHSPPSQDVRTSRDRIDTAHSPHSPPSRGVYVETKI